MSKLNIITIMLIIMTVVAGSITYSKWNHKDDIETIILLSGPRGGSYYNLALTMKKILSNECRITVKVTNGTFDNRSRMIAGEGDLALCQNMGIKEKSLELIAALHPEVVYVLARNGIDSLWQVPRNSSVYIGPDNSGTQVRAKEILEQYRLLGRVKTTSSIPYSELKQGFIDNQLDVAFLVLGEGTNLVRDIVETQKVTLLNIEMREGLARRNPANHIDVVPANTFKPGLPAADVKTISNTATLVARPGLPKEFILDLINVMRQKNLMTLSDLDQSKFDYPFHSVLEDLQQDRWPTSIHWEKIHKTKGWFLTTFIFAFVTLFLIIFRRSVQESMDEFFFINSYRSRLREIQEKFQNNEDPLALIEDAQQLAEEITRDVQSGMVEKSVQIIFIHHEILQLVSKLIKREVIDSHKIKEV